MSQSEVNVGFFILFLICICRFTHCSS